MPERIQLRRTKGWRLPANAVSVARPTRYGNPVVVGSEAQVGVTGADGLGYVFVVNVTPEFAVACFEEMWRLRLERSATHPDDIAVEDQWRADLEALRGKDLACWCAENEPCHATVLLSLANRPLE